MPEIFKKTGSITASTTWELDIMDLSLTRALRIGMDLTDPGALVGDTLNIYFQMRFSNGVWTDRVALAQLLGNGGAKHFVAEIQSDVPLGATEESGTAYGPSPLTHLTADSVVNGAFPPMYTGGVTNLLGRGPGSQPQANARFEFVESGTATWPITLTVDADERAGAAF